MRTRTNLFLMGSIVLLAALVPFATVGAQEPTPSDDEVNAIAKELYCPVCPNEPLDTCSTLACVQWREEIRERLTLGWDVEEIKDYFVAQYGDRVLSTPPARGLNWLVYVLPPLAILAGLFFLVRAMVRWSRATAVEKATTVEADDPYVARMEQELRKRD
jgi:cytochrome c-type biogenesis protein CcmH